MLLLLLLLYTIFPLSLSLPLEKWASKEVSNQAYRIHCLVKPIIYVHINCFVHPTNIIHTMAYFDPCALLKSLYNAHNKNLHMFSTLIFFLIAIKLTDMLWYDLHSSVGGLNMDITLEN